MSTADRWENGVDKGILFWLVVIHLAALAAPFFFSFQGLIVALVLYGVTAWGISVGYHRYFTHRGFRTSKPVRLGLALVGGLAGEGPVLQWVAVHRKHHAHSDKDGDPHSPVHGPWWAHMFWFLPKMSDKERDEFHAKWCQDLYEEGEMRFISRTYMVWQLLLAGALFAIGYLGWDLRTGLSLLFWGMAVRLVLVLHATWAVNSASHLWGYRTYQTRDNSRNLWWLALITFGEGWHNNHHAFPASARFGHKWYEMDLGYWSIWLMEKLGLVWGVRKTA